MVCSKIKKFDFENIDNFDEHILQSIPNYDILFNSILRISDYFKDEEKIIYDIGCSTGKFLKYINEKEQYKGKMIGIDNSKNLLPKSTENITFLNWDLNQPYEFDNACLIFSIFTIQFLKKENRLPLIENIYNGLCSGGAFIIAEKTYAEEGTFQDIFTFSYYDYKQVSFTNEEILNKEKNLRTILKPNYPKENISMLKKAGFAKIKMFYKYFNFEAYLCIK